MNKQQVIIIPVHNQLPYLIKAIESVIRKTKEYELIIVDDGSTDYNIREYLSSNEGIFTLLINETAQGFSAACNKGIQYAIDNFDFNCLCLLNSDAEVVTENWFDKVEHYFVNGENVGVASVMSDNAMAQTVKNVPEYLKVIDSKPAVLTRICHGFCFFMSKKVIETIGLFDVETFVAYGGEDDYALRSIKYGFNNIIVGSVFVKHHGEASYSPSVRSKFIKTTLPTLQRRWGYKYVADCVNQANKIGQYLNNI